MYCKITAIFHAFCRARRHYSPVGQQHLVLMCPNKLLYVPIAPHLPVRVREACLVKHSQEGVSIVVYAAIAFCDVVMPVVRSVINLVYLRAGHLANAKINEYQLFFVVYQQISSADVTVDDLELPEAFVYLDKFAAVPLKQVLIRRNFKVAQISKKLRD